MKVCAVRNMWKKNKNIRWIIHISTLVLFDLQCYIYLAQNARLKLRCSLAIILCCCLLQFPNLHVAQKQYLFYLLNNTCSALECFKETEFHCCMLCSCAVLSIQVALWEHVSIAWWTGVYCLVYCLVDRCLLLGRGVYTI